MGDVPMPAPTEPTRTEVAVERLASLVALVLDVLSLLLTGDRGGNVRRPILFLTAALAIAIQPFNVLTIMGIMSIMLLALTDTPTVAE